MHNQDRMLLSIGVDMVDVREIEASIASFGERYLQRVYTPGELAYARSGEMAKRLGARFAAKEAAIKALGVTDVGIDWRSIEVVRGPAGDPSLVLAGSAKEIAKRVGVSSLALSVTHQGHLATAVVVATRKTKRHA